MRNENSVNLHMQGVAQAANGEPLSISLPKNMGVKMEEIWKDNR